LCNACKYFLHDTPTWFSMERGTIPIIPRPASLQEREGEFSIATTSVILVDEAFLHVGQNLARLLSIAAGREIPVEIDDGRTPAEGTITIKKDSSGVVKGIEGYTLEIAPDHVEILATAPAGAYSGTQSLRQLLPPWIEAPSTFTPPEGMTIPCLRIDDAPRFPWRGFMLDVGRFFFGKELIKKLLDAMACLKMNVFHWHLTEDQGWRIEIKRYPNLTEIGAKRRDSQAGGFASTKHTGVPHDGFYTQDDAREIVAYAAERFIAVVPEIETPGHSQAMLAAYPDLSCTGGPFEVSTRVGIHPDVLCPGKDRVFEFLDGVLDEVLDIFPSKFIHIGGDETPRARWKHCPDCQARIKAEGIPDVHALQTYFTNRVAAMLKVKERALMGWNEVLGADLDPGAIVQFWKGGTKQMLPHAKKGRKFVMSEFLHVYIDHDYDLLPLHTVYNYDPIPKGLPAEYHENILGIEVPLWTEWVRNERRLYWQLFPRLLAVAEVGWTPKRRTDFASFVGRVPSFLERLARMGMQSAPLDKAERSSLLLPLGILRLAVTEPHVPGDSTIRKK